MVGLTETGLEIKSLTTIKEELDAGLKQIFGNELSLDPSTPEAQLNGIMAEHITILYEIAIGVYQGLNPNFAKGNQLDLVSQIRGVIRNPATSTIVPVTFNGTTGTTIPAGSIFKATGLPNFIFTLNSDSLVEDGGLVTCTSLGAVVVPALTMTEIVNPTFGLDSVTNTDAGVTGNDLETDEELRIRSNASVSIASQAIIESVFANISAIPEVEQVLVLENDTSAIDANGVSPKSMHAIVLGGADSDIAEAIFNKKSLGCGMDGDVVVVVTDINDISHDVSFSRPNSLPIFITVNVTELVDWDTAIVDRIKTDLISFATTSTSLGLTFDGYQMGNDVHASQLYFPLLNEDEFAITSILVGTSSPGAAASVPISFSEIATFLEADITVNVTP